MKLFHILPQSNTGMRDSLRYQLHVGPFPATTVLSMLIVRKDFIAGGAVLSEAFKMVGSAVAATRRSLE